MNKALGSHIASQKEEIFQLKSKLTKKDEELLKMSESNNKVSVMLSEVSHRAYIR